MRFCSSTREWPGVSFFVPLKKESSATSEGKSWGCGCSVDACGGSIVDWRTTAYALFHCMDQRFVTPKCLWQMPAALQSEAAPRFGQCRRDGRGSGGVSEWRNESTRFVLCCWCENQPFRDRRFCWQGQCHHCLDHRGKATYPLLWPIRKASLRVCICLQGTSNRPCLVSGDQTNCEFVDVGGGHQARLLLRRTTIGAQFVVKTMDLLVGNLTAAFVILGNHLQTAIQRLLISKSQIRAGCLGTAQVEVQLNSLNVLGSGTDMGGAYWCSRRSCI